MLQQGYYDLTHTEASSGSEANNNTPFSVKDILNMVESGAGVVDGYLNCQMERWVGKWLYFVINSFDACIKSRFLCIRNQFLEKIIFHTKG